jgi:hypothetical protein
MRRKKVYWVVDYSILDSWRALIRSPFRRDWGTPKIYLCDCSQYFFSLLDLESQSSGRS